MQTSSPGKALIVDDEKTNRRILKSLLVKQGYRTIEAVNGRQAVDLFEQEKPDIVFMDVMMPVMNGYEAARQIKAASVARFVPIIFLTAMDDEKALAQCIVAGGDDFLVKPYDNVILQSKIRSMRRIATLQHEVQGMYSVIHREQEIAESVYSNAIQGSNIKNRFLRHAVQPASIFSGDMVLSAYSPQRDLYFLAGDFTGHGLLAALGAMPVSEVFRAMTTKGFSAEEILAEINRKLKALLPVDMFFAAQLVVVNHDLGHLRVFNAGMPDVLVIDGASHEVRHRFASRGLPLGVGVAADTRDMLQYAPIHYNDKILMYSDGLIEARDGNEQAFGAERLLQAISTAPRDQIFDHILERLDAWCGKRSQADDVTLAEISCVQEVLPAIEVPELIQPAPGAPHGGGEWKLSLRFEGARLRETDPVPVLVNYVMEMETLHAERQSLFTVMTELYTNALDHGVLELDSTLKNDPAGFKAYYQARRSRLANLDSGYVSFELSAHQQSSRRSILLRVEDSGSGFDHARQPGPGNRDIAFSGRGLAIVRDLCETLQFEGRGNVAVARFGWSTA